MKAALITGCNRGLGMQLLIDFARGGYTIIALIRKQSDEFDAVVQELMNKYSIVIYTFYAEFSSQESLDLALDKVEGLGLEIDVLINNAGVRTKAKPIFYMNYQDVEDALKVNYLAPFLITKRVASLMIRAGRGSIIDITTVVSSNITSGETAYGASKAALNLSIQTLSQELAPFGIRINGIACGCINTGIFQSLEDKLKKKTLQRVAMKRPAELAEISSIVQFLASEKSSYMTGSIIKVDGGFV